jgi:hypothetical protein
VTPAMMNFLRPVALTAAAKFSSSIALTMPTRLMRVANSAGRIDSNCSDLQWKIREPAIHPAGLQSFAADRDYLQI